MYKFDILETEDCEIKKVDSKSLYNTDNRKSLSKWVSKNNGGQKIDFPHLSSSCKISNNSSCGYYEDSIGYIQNKSNNVYENGTGVSILTAPYSNAHGFNININNLFDSTIVLSVRKMITKNWKNEKDEYLAPNEQHEQFEQFKYDSLVYSLFNSASNQSSLRQVEYKDKLWDIKNEFFWMSADRMKELADENGYDELYNDARTASDRHVYKLLFGEERIYDKLSDDAKEVLDKATEMVENSIQMRQMMANDENHLNSWDAGYAQLKLVWKEYFPEDFKEFRELYKSLENRMRPLVYELGFLMK